MDSKKYFNKKDLKHKAKKVKKEKEEEAQAKVEEPLEEENQSAEEVVEEQKQEEIEAEVDVVEEPSGGRNEEKKDDKYFSTMKFSEMNLSEQTLKAVDGLGFSTCSEIQARSIPHILNGRDVLGAAKTGSGKTLAYMLPAVELLRKARFTPKQGTGVLVIAPTRELAMQNYKWARDLL